MLRRHRNSKNHDGSPRATIKVKDQPHLLDIHPHCTIEGLFNFASPIRNERDKFTFGEQVVAPMLHYWRKLCSSYSSLFMHGL